jgi:hypothetical protein
MFEHQHLPYIPPPDYTMRFKAPQKPKATPTQINYPTKQQRQRDDHGKPHHYLPVYLSKIKAGINVFRKFEDLPKNLVLFLQQ